MYTVNYCLDMATAEIDKLEYDEIFTLKDLFKGYEWNRISRGDRIALGTMFLNYAKANKAILLLGKSKSGQQRYKKIDLG